MSERQVCMIGGGMSQWGRRSASLVDVVQEAAKACFDDIPGIKRKDIDGFLFASSYCGRNPFQVNAAPVMAERIGIIHRGRLAAVGTREELRRQSGAAGPLEQTFLSLTGEGQS